MCASTEWSVVVLPEPVGPTTQDQPVRLLGRRPDLAQIALDVMPSLSIGMRLVGGEEAHDDVLVAALGRHGRHAKLEIAAVGQAGT